MIKQRSNIESTRRNESGDIFSSWSWARTLSSSVLNYVPTVRVPSQTIVFFTVTKPIQYIYQIEDCKMLVKNHGSIHQESLPFGWKAVNLQWNLTGKVTIHQEWWVWLERSRNAEFENSGDGWKTRQRWHENDQNCHGSMRPRPTCRPHGLLSSVETLGAWSSAAPLPLSLVRARRRGVGNDEIKLAMNGEEDV